MPFPFYRKTIYIVYSVTECGKAVVLGIVISHGINDIDTGNILSVKSGNILNCDILSVSKSSKGHPGEINGAFDGNTIGNISINSQIGIYGNMSCDEFSSDNTIPVAAKEQIGESDAYILSDVIGQKTEKYSIKINKITNDSDKGLIIEITAPISIPFCIIGEPLIP